MAVLPIFFPSVSVSSVVFVVLIFWTIKSGFSDNFWRIIGAGFIVDLVCNFPVGTSILSFCVATFAAGSLSKRIFVSRKVWGFLAMLVIFGFSSLVSESVFSFLREMFFWKGLAEEENFNIINILGGIFKNTAFGLVVFVLAYWPLEKLDAFLSFYSQSSFQKTRFLK